MREWMRSRVVSVEEKSEMEMQVDTSHRKEGSSEK
jgi:hypothetical protein